MQYDRTDARPDIVVFMTDQQRFDQIGYSSDGGFETPNLDSLAAAGLVFDNAYSASTVCVPSRVALLTGLQPHRVPSQENPSALREGFWTVAHELRRAGYQTALMGKMHFSPIHSRHGFEVMRLCEHLSAQGLGPLAVEREDTVDDYHTWLVSQGLTDRRVESDGRAGHVPSSLPPEAHPTAWVEAEAASFLSGRDRERPMFLVISFPHPHAPYDPPEPYASMYDPADSVVPKVGYAANEQLPMAFQLATEASTTREAAADQHGLRRFLATVKGLVKQIDDSVGRLAASLDLESTVVFFTSDHGDYAGHRGLLRKNPWIPFDDLVRVPFFVSGADIAGGRRVDHLVQSCDLALTCLDYAGLAPPEGVVFDSRSLRPILEGAPRASDTDRAVFAATTVMWPMVRRGSYKYIEHGEHGKQGQAVLFDLEADPHETVNVADDAALAGVRDELVELLDRLLAQPVLDLMID